MKIKTLSFILFWVTLTLSLSAQKRTIHLIILSDIEDPELGMASRADEELMINMASEASSTLDYPLHTIVLSNSNFNTRKVISTLTNLREKPGDLILFYYTGRSEFPSRSSSRFPTFKLNGFFNNKLEMDEVARIIDQKEHALGIVMADCRNSIFDLPIAVGDMGILEDMVPKMAVLNLLFSSCGVIKLANAGRNKVVPVSSRVGASAFTFGFTEAFSRSVNSATLSTIENFNFNHLVAMGTLTAQTRDEEIEPVMEILPCRSIRKSLVFQKPDFNKIVLFSTLQDAIIKVGKARSSSEKKEILSPLEKGFSSDAKVTVKTIDPNSSTVISEKTLTVENYFKRISSPDSVPVLRRIPVGGVERSADNMEITQFSIEEMAD
ncbi:hypothetical protein [Jiulongibacter sediminis]|nr:hypothetical protein [Jiulongibacter sediminis]